MRKHFQNRVIAAMSIFTWWRGLPRIGIGGAVLLATALPLTAVERDLHIEAPAEVAAGSTFTVTISVATDAGQGERIGFLQMDKSAGEGGKWEPVCYLDNLGAKCRQVIPLTADKPEGEIRLRVRVAFRGGLAGDVDQTGAAIRWTGTWANWCEPVARYAAIRLRAPK